MDHRNGYTTINRVRAEGLTAAQADDNRVRDLIFAMSSFVDIETGQYFHPRVAIEEVDGNDFNVVSVTKRIPILEVSSVTVLEDRTRPKRPLFGSRSLAPLGTGFSAGDPLGAVPSNQYLPNGRYLELISGNFREGVRNIRIDGAFGWLNPSKEKFETTLRSPITVFTPTSVKTIELTTVEGLDIRDVLIVGGKRFIIESINPIGPSVSAYGIDQLTTDIPDTEPVISYGAAPFDIERVVISLVGMHAALEFAAPAGMPASTIPTPIQIKKETTDNYSWEAFSPEDVGLDDSWVGRVTGKVELDLILAHYAAPALVLVV